MIPINFFTLYFNLYSFIFTMIAIFGLACNRLERRGPLLPTTGPTAGAGAYPRCCFMPDFDLFTVSAARAPTGPRAGLLPRQRA